MAVDVDHGRLILLDKNLLVTSEERAIAKRWLYTAIDSMSDSHWCGKWLLELQQSPAPTLTGENCAAHAHGLKPILSGHRGRMREDACSPEMKIPPMLLARL